MKMIAPDIIIACDPSSIIPAFAMYHVGRNEWDTWTVEIAKQGPSGKGPAIPYSFSVQYDLIKAAMAGRVNRWMLKGVFIVEAQYFRRNAQVAMALTRNATMVSCAALELGAVVLPPVPASAWQAFLGSGSREGREDRKLLALEAARKACPELDLDPKRRPIKDNHDQDIADAICMVLHRLGRGRAH